MKQGDFVTAIGDFSFKNQGARGRAVQVKIGQQFWVTNPTYQHKEYIMVQRAGKGHINTGYAFSVEDFSKFFATDDETV